MTVTRVRWPAEPGFNRAAADAVYKALTSLDDDSALIFGRLLVAEGIRYDLAGHGYAIAKMLDADAQARIGLLKKRLARTAIAKSRRGEDNLPELARLATLTKGYNRDEARDWRGRWATFENRRFAEHAPIFSESGTKPMNDSHAENLGIPKPPDKDTAGNNIKWSAADRTHYQQAYLQIQEMVQPYRRSGSNPLLHLQVADRNGNFTEQVVPIPPPGKPGKKPKKGETLEFAQHLGPGKRVAGAAVSTKQVLSAPGAAYDVMAAAGQPRAGGYLAGAAQKGGALSAEGMTSYREALDEAALQQQTPAGRAFARLGASSKLMQDTLGEYAPPKLALAMAVGEHVGRFGPEAQKVIGPAADKAAYRYRGTERKVDPEMARVLGSVRNIRIDRPDGQVDVRATMNARREALIHGFEDEEGVEQAWTPSRLHDYFGPGGKVLPKADLNTLQRKSGVIPPSQGIILNDRGEISVQAVGFGDDWYLPFNLKNLKSLKGGEYVRTRTFGGLTTEDLYTGLMSGARSMTVVSHSGVFTIEFDPTMRGGRRFSDKALAMTGRYGHLLDAVKSRDVTLTDIHPSRLAELEETAAGLADPIEDEKEYKSELERLKKKEMRNPELSQQQKDEASTEFLFDLASRTETKTGVPQTPAQMNDNLIELMAQRGFKAHIAGAKALGVEPVRDLATYREEAYAQLRDESPTVTAQNIADALGKTRQYEAWMKAAANENKLSLTPLKLDANGYRLAQDALMEQFPYYIDRVDFHPFPLAAPHTDTGYIMPRHNRPAEVLSGYYATGIEGLPGTRKGEKGEGRESGKYRAHTGRYQNYPVHQGRLDLVGAKKEREGEEATTGAGKKGTKYAPEQEAALRRQSAKNLLNEILSQTKFPPGTVIQGVTMQPGDNPHVLFNAGRDAPNQKDTEAIKEIFVAAAKDKDELEARLDDPDKEKAMIDLLTRALNQIKNNPGGSMFDLGSKVVADFKAGGKRPEAKKPETSASRILAELDKDYSWGENYLADKEQNLKTLANRYEADGRAKRLVALGLLPKKLDDNDFDTKAKAAGKKLKADNQAWLNEPPSMSGHTLRGKELDKDAAALHRAMQLRRRHDDTVKLEGEKAKRAAEAEVLRQQAGQPRTQTAVVLGGEPPNREDFPNLDEYLTAMKQYHEQREDLLRRYGGGGGALPPGSPIQDV